MRCRSSKRASTTELPERSGPGRQNSKTKLAALWPIAKPENEFRWSGTFDSRRDGLPLIGTLPGAKGIYAAYGYDGNGITFSFLAARLIGDLIVRLQTIHAILTSVMAATSVGRRASDAASQALVPWILA